MLPLLRILGSNVDGKDVAVVVGFETEILEYPVQLVARSELPISVTLKPVVELYLPFKIKKSLGKDSPG